MFTKISQSRFLLLIGILVISLPATAEEITVDREEYENLKKAVEYLMSQQKEAIDKATRAEEKADEATEIATATAEVVEDSPLDVFEGISLGGYGEVHYNNLDADDSNRDVDEIDIHRFVLFLGKEFNDDLRFVSELEVEHSIAGEGKNGEVEVEQAFIEYDINDNTQVRGGVFLLPLGILNETHEPPTFYGVERNDVENIIIPATWWEAGIGTTIASQSGISFDAAFHSGLNIPSTGGNAGRIRSGRQKVSEAAADDFAATARLKYTGIQGLELAASVQHQFNPTQDDDSDVEDDFIDDGTLYETHAIYNHGPFGLRALYAQWDFSGDIEDVAGDIDEQFGWYVEPSFKPLDSLGLYARYEEVEGARVQDQFSQWEVGLNWWPHPDVVVKADYRDRSHDPEAEDQGRDFDGFDIGIGYMF